MPSMPFTPRLARTARDEELRSGGQCGEKLARHGRLGWFLLASESCFQSRAGTLIRVGERQARAGGSHDAVGEREGGGDRIAREDQAGRVSGVE